MHFAWLVLMACTISTPSAPPLRTVVVANDSAQVVESVAVRAGGVPVQAAQRLAPGRVVVVDVPEGQATVWVGDRELALPASGGATVLMDSDGEEWAVGPLLWAEPPTVEVGRLPWGSRLSDDLSTGSLAADRVERLMIAPWPVTEAAPTHREQIAGGTAVEDPARIAAFLEALRDAHRSRPAGAVSDGRRWIVQADLGDDVSAWFILTAATAGTTVQPPPMVHEAGRHDRTVGPLDRAAWDALLGGDP